MSLASAGHQVTGQTTEKNQLALAQTGHIRLAYNTVQLVIRPGLWGHGIKASADAGNGGILLTSASFPRGSLYPTTFVCLHLSSLAEKSDCSAPE